MRAVLAIGWHVKAFLVRVLMTWVALAMASKVFGQEPSADRPPASATKIERFYVQTSLYTKHFSFDERHNDRQALINLEWQRADDTLWGASWLRNSFSQPSQYVYYGKQWRPLDSFPLLHLKLTGGFVHGYKGEFRDKIPFNRLGVAPALLPAIGLSGKRFGAELILFGNSGLMLTGGFFIDR
jgi:hypothetical protein